MKPRHWRSGMARAMLVALAFHATDAVADGPTPKPTCGQTAWLAIRPVSDVVNPPDNGQITFPTKVMAFIDWNKDCPECAQPVGASIDISFMLVPIDGGETLSEGPFTLTVATPTMPGPQLVSATFSPFIGAMKADPAKTYRVKMTGNYRVTFGPGIGTGTVTSALREYDFDSPGAGLAPPATGTTTTRRATLDLIADNPSPTPRSRFDFQYNYFTLRNNEDKAGMCMVRIESTTLSRMPQGTNADNTFYAAVNPAGDTWSLALQHSPTQVPGPRPPSTDPNVAAPAVLDFSMPFSPFGMILLPVGAAMPGTMPDGAGGEFVATATLMYDDGSLAVARAGSFFQSGGNAPRTPAIEVTDTIRAAPDRGVLASPMTVNPGARPTDIHMTHCAGNQVPPAAPGTMVAGAEFAAATGMDCTPPSSTDYLRDVLGDGPISVNYGMSYDEQSGGEITESRSTNYDVMLGAMPPDGTPIDESIPAITLPPSMTPVTNVAIDLSNDTITVTDSEGEVVHIGGYLDFLNGPPEPITLDTVSPREVFMEERDLDELRLFSNYRDHASELTSLANSWEEGGLLLGTGAFGINGVPRRGGPPSFWTATSNHPMIVVETPSGEVGAPIRVRINPDMVPTAPTATTALVTVTSPQALNSPTLVPFVLWQRPLAPTQEMMVDAMLGRLLLNPDNREAFDFNGNGAVDIGDLVMLVNMGG